MHHIGKAARKILYRGHRPPIGRPHTPQLFIGTRGIQVQINRRIHRKQPVKGSLVIILRHVVVFALILSPCKSLQNGILTVGF